MREKYKMIFKPPSTLLKFSNGSTLIFKILQMQAAGR